VNKSSFNPLAKYLSSLEVSSATSADKPPEGFTTNSSTKTKGTSKKGKSAAGDETKKKGGRSRGVEQLKKADTKGMNKLSTFFTKK
jgi:ribonuclease H2 subunit B